MKIEIMSGGEVIVVVNDLLDEYRLRLSSQLEISCRRFVNSSIDGDSFMVVCKDDSGCASLACGYHVDSELGTINIPFVLVRRDITPLIRGRSLIMAINAFLKITQEYSNYSFFATATPKARRIINKLITPPFKLVGVMQNYFTHGEHNEDAYLFWIPSIVQSNKLDGKEV